jgi:hypothetical protein
LKPKGLISGSLSKFELTSVIFICLGGIAAVLSPPGDMLSSMLPPATMADVFMKSLLVMLIIYNMSYNLKGKTTLYAFVPALVSLVFNNKAFKHKGHKGQHKGTPRENFHKIIISTAMFLIKITSCSPDPRLPQRFSA